MNSTEQHFQMALEKITKKEHWSHKDAEAVIKVMKNSGSSDAAFARKHAIPYPRLKWWKYKLEKKQHIINERNSPSFVEVKVVDDQQRKQINECNLEVVNSKLEVVLSSGRSIKVEEGFNQKTLQELIMVLEQCPC